MELPEIIFPYIHEDISNISLKEYLLAIENFREKILCINSITNVLTYIEFINKRIEEVKKNN